MQSKYPPIEGQSDPVPAGNEAQVLTGSVQTAGVRGFDAATSRELPEKRGRTERTFANVDGTQTTEFGRDPMNFQRSDGSWQPIDTSLVPQDKGWRNAADSVGRWLAPAASQDRIAMVDLDEQHRFEFGVDGARSSAGQANGSSVTYPQIRPGADLTLEVTSIGLKETIVLHSTDAPQSWLFPLRLKGLVPSIVDGVVVLSDEQGKVRARIPQGFMVDSNIDEHLGEGATSFGVTYQLVDVKGQPALRMDLDAAWLGDPARVYPVMVDPPVDLRDAASSMYVQRNSGGSSFSRADGELKAGRATDSAGTYTAASYIAFPGVENALWNHRIFGAQLAITNYWSWSCNARPISVHPVLQPWSAGPGWSYPGPAYGGELAGANFAHGYIPRGATRSPCPTAVEAVNLGWAGRDLVERWVTGQQPNYGLSVRASETDVFGWKKFTGAGTANPPRLAVTHSPYHASYRFDNPVPNPPVTRTQGGRVKISVTNLGAHTWDPGSYVLGYRYFTANGSYLGWAEAATLPGDVPRGGSVQLDALIQPTPPGSYRFEFTMIHRGVAAFTDEQVPPAALAFTVIDVPPVLKAQYPPNGYSAPTLTPSLWAQAVDVDAPPNSSLQYRFEVCQQGPVNCFDSGRRPSPAWTIPNGRLQWGKTYQWRVFAFDGTSESPALPFSNLLTAVPQPGITAHLGNALYGGGSGEFDPQVGNYTTSAIDATVATVGPQLSVVRTYNSLDPRRDAMFGAGWSSSFDMRITPDNDGSGNVVVMYQDGRQVRFGSNRTLGGLPDGGQLVAPPGSFITLTPVQQGGWRLTDKSASVFLFGPDGKLRKIDDNAGRSMVLTYGTDGKLASATNQTSNRALRFTWSGSHVSTIDTDPIGGTPLRWTYTYTGDRLTSVCDPNGGCTRYEQTNGSHYRSAVLDSRPDSYWRFGERAGTDAVSQVSLNLGTDKARYNNVTLGGTGVLAGTDDPSAGFNGTSSVITLPDGIVRKSHELTIEMWFKTGTSGPLFGAQDAPQGSVAHSTVPILYIGDDGKLRGQFWIGQVNPITTTGTVTDNQWHHVVLTSSVATQTLYLDGQTVGSLSGVIDDSTLSHAQVGSAFSHVPGWPQWGNINRRFFSGAIDEVAVYQHPIGLPVVQAHFASRAGTDYLARTTLPSGKLVAQLSYDTALDRLSQYTDRNGGMWTLGAPVTSGSPTNIIRTVRVTDPGNRAHFYDYDPIRGRIVRYLAPLGMETRSEDRPPPATPPPPPGGGSFPPVDFQGARTFDYDEAGFPSTIFDENANSITLTHDARGNITRRTTCRTGPTDCQTAYFDYPSVGSNPIDPRLDKVIAARDARSTGATDNRYKTSYTYSPLGQLETQTTPDGAVVRHTYSAGTEPAFGGGTTPPGLIITTADPRNAITRYAYYPTGDLAEVRSPSGLITRYTYDTLGRRTATTEISDSHPLGVTSNLSFDKLGRLISFTGPAVTNEVTGVTHTIRYTTGYDADGNPTQTEESDLTGGDPTRTSSLHYDEHNRLVRATDPEGGETSLGYDAFGNRTRMVNAAGVQYEFAYTARNMLSEVRLRGWNGDPSGAEPGPSEYLVVAAYTYDLAGQLVRSVDAMGRITRFRYYSDNLLRQVIAQGIHNPDGTTRDLVLATYVYDAAGNLSRQTNAGGLVTTFEADVVGRRSATTLDPTGLARRTALRYDLNGNVTQVSMTGKESNTGSAGDSAAEVVDYGYDAVGRQTSQTVHTGTEDLTTTWGYDQRGFVTSITDPRGTASGADPAAFTTNIRYDPLGRPVAVTAPPVTVETVGTQPVSRRPTSTTGYDTFGNATETTDPNGNTWRSSFDKAGRLTSSTTPDYTPPGATQPINSTTRFEYDPLGQIASATGARGAVTRYAYDQLGRLTERTDPNPESPADPGGVWRYTYTRTGEMLSATDPSGARVEATYDDLRRQITGSILERQPTPGTFTGRLTYDDAGNLRTTAAPSGALTRYEYDILGQTTKVTTASNVATQFGYDRAGRMVKTTDAAGRSHRTTVDLTGRTLQELDYAPTGALLRQVQFGYDRAGNVSGVTDPHNRVTQFTADALGRLTQQVEPVSATESITTSFGYDAAGNRTRYTDGRGNSTIYTVNSWGLAESVIEPATAAHPDLPERTWTAAYDASANPVSLVSPGGVRKDSTFNEVGQLTRVTGSGAEAPTTEKNYTYDILGRLATSNAPGGTNTFTYNDRGALLSTSGPSGDSTFDYNADGDLTARNDAAGIARYGYTNGRLATLQDGITGATQTLGYNSAGQLSTIDYGGGRLRTFTYDDLARVATDTLTTSGSQVASQSYGYDLNGRLTEKTTQGVAGAGINTYGYDFTGRLTSWTKDGATTAYGWDAAGNRTRAADKTASFDERNRLISDGTSGYTYSPRGTLATKTTGAATETFAFDALDRLISQGPTRYSYDALDRAAARNGQRFTYTGASNELATDGSTRFSRGPLGELLALGSGPDKRLTVADQHGDVIGGFDPGSSAPGLADSVSYDPFGTPTATSGARRPIGYQGDYTDPDTGQVNMTARWYNPATGAFLSRDSAGLPTMPSGMANRYSYTGGSPLNHTDPTGHWPSCSWVVWRPQCCLFSWACKDIPGGHDETLPICGVNTHCGSDDETGDQSASGPIGSGLGMDNGSAGSRGPPGRGGRGGGTGGRGGGGTAAAGGGSGGSSATTAARQAAKDGARNNPQPIPTAVKLPVYVTSTAAPVSSAPDVPSQQVADSPNVVNDVDQTYRDLQNSLTVDQGAVLGEVKGNTAAPTEVTPGGGTGCPPTAGPLCHVTNTPSGVGRHAEGFARGAGAAAGDLLGDLWNTLNALGSCTHFGTECGDLFRGLLQSVEQLVTDPLGFLNDVWHSYWDPIKDAINRGEYGEALGQAVVGILTNLNPTRGILTPDAAPGQPSPHGTTPGQKALPPGTPGKVEQNGLRDHEPKQAQDIVDFRGGTFKGAPTPTFEGIDGWLNGNPASLKSYSGTSLSGLGRHLIDAEDSARKAGYTNVELYIDAQNMPRDLVLQSYKAADVLRGGTIGVIYVHTRDGWVVFPGK